MASGMRRAKMRDLPHRLDYAALSNCDKQPLKPDSTKTAAQAYFTARGFDRDEQRNFRL
jgi:hypothetical protein